MPDPFHEAVRANVEAIDRGAPNQMVHDHLLRDCQALRISPQALVQEVDRIENMPGHAHRDFAVANRGGFVDIVPIQGYGSPPPVEAYPGSYPGAYPGAYPNGGLQLNLNLNGVVRQIIHPHRQGW